MNKKIFFILTIFLSLGIAKNSFSQDTIDRMILIGTYTPTLTESFKLSERPQFDPPTDLKPKLTYQINSKHLTTTYNLEPIGAAKMSGEPLNKLYKSLIKFGWGTYTSPMLEYYFNNNRSKKHSLGAYFKHLSSDGTVKNTPYSGFSQNEAKLYGEKFFKTHTLGSSLYYKRDAVYFYGLGVKERLGDYSKKDFKKDFGQSFQTFNAEVDLKSLYLNHDRLHHVIKANYMYFGDQFNTSEHLVALKSHMEREVELDAELQEEKITLDINGLYNNTSLKTDTFNVGLIQIKPMVQFTSGDFRFKGGISAFVESETISNMRFIPSAQLSLDLIKNIIAIDAGIDGNIHRSNFNALATENPFIISNPEMRFTREKLDIFAGIRGNFTPNLSFLARADKQNILDMPFFVNDTLSLFQNRFAALYDDVAILKVYGEVSWQKTEKLRFSLDGTYRDFTMENQMKPWHIPTLEIKLGTQYNIQDKIIARFDVVYNNASYARRYNEANQEYAYKLKSIVDINFGLEYRYTSILSAFLKFNNIAAQKYSQWYGYPNQRFSLMGGLTYSF